MIIHFYVFLIINFNFYFNIKIFGNNYYYFALEYNEDLSLAEISEINKTSRQAIYDLIKRCCKQLLVYEKKLELMKKQNYRLRKKDDLMQKIRENHISEKLLNYIEINIDDIINA